MTLALFSRRPRGLPVAAVAVSTLGLEEAPRLKSISVVVPVRDNPHGLARLGTWWRGLGEDQRPLELIVVDDASRVPVEFVAEEVRILQGGGRGPACARNVGWRAAKGPWVAFLDSDCLPAAGWPASFATGWRGEVAVQGAVRAMGTDWLSSYYESQGVLRPMAWTEDGRPQYLISANCLVHRDTLERIGGFGERFPLAAGEDVDLGLRLSQIGALRWCADASVAHDFEPSMRAFVRRFLRYGRGNRMLAEGQPESAGDFFSPRPFLPLLRRPENFLLAGIAFVALGAGWLLGGHGTKPPSKGSLWGD
ncbi:glycosyltransferase [Corallococcus praedator]|uniref:Glycosyltransferase n=1 Tax=Corallococcus praedator TaxID=2316724 RepID=A0ABX9QIX1_9BACT|nr:glycosyltransferase [Corallococcus sp. CA031C]RKI09651.1 glycosyltransferase [Corallococcus praedator]